MKSFSWEILISLFRIILLTKTIIDSHLIMQLQIFHAYSGGNNLGGIYFKNGCLNQEHAVSLTSGFCVLTF